MRNEFGIHVFAVLSHSKEKEGGNENDYVRKRFAKALLEIIQFVLKNFSCVSQKYFKMELFRVK